VRWVWWAAGGFLLVAVVGAVLALEFVTANTPARLTLSDQARPTSAPESPTPAVLTLGTACPFGTVAEGDVLWKVQAGSKAGFRAREKFSPYVDTSISHEAVVRSDQVAGYVISSVDRSRLRSACVAVDLRSLKSVDRMPPPMPASSNRDELFGFLLGLDQFPIATFELNEMDLPGSSEGKKVRLTAAGELTIRGASLPATFAADCRWQGKVAECAGSTTVDARRFGVVVPGDSGPIKVDPTVTLEFALTLAA
jgi:YceI-like protein